ncbi:MAG: hypothetical protein V1929_10860 [bacterium]
MTEKQPSEGLARTPEEIADILRRSRPSDFDGHTDFHRLTSSQRLDWLAQAAAFVHEFKGAVRRKPA